MKGNPEPLSGPASVRMRDHEIAALGAVLEVLEIADQYFLVCSRSSKGDWVVVTAAVMVAPNSLRLC